MNADINNLYVSKATIVDLNAAIARIGILEADHVSVETLNAVDAKFKNLNASNIKTGNLNVDLIDIEKLFAKSGSAVDLSVGSFFCHTSTTQLSNCGTVQTSSLSVAGTYASWKTATLPNGTTISYLGS